MQLSTFRYRLMSYCQSVVDQLDYSRWILNEWIEKLDDEITTGEPAAYHVQHLHDFQIVRQLIMLTHCFVHFPTAVTEPCHGCNVALLKKDGDTSDSNVCEQRGHVPSLLFCLPCRLSKNLKMY